ncbi:MAG: UPF0182 family protein [Actinomycetota bacterium]|nr:UPF0182 family protein [Actinomycetota bacterium]
MRTPADLPRPRRSGRARASAVAIAVVGFFGLTSVRGIAGVYTDFLWFAELGLTSVWKGTLLTKFALAGVFTVAFFVLLWVNLALAERLAPRFRAMGPDDELVQRYREAVGTHAGKVRVVVAALFALLAGVNTATQWHNWLLFRNSVDFGIADPQFQRDISFYVFRLPFMSFLVDWAFFAILITTLVTLVAHYLNGGIRPQGPAPRVTSQVKAHISLLVGLLALLRAADYWLQRFELSFSTRGAVHGATYTDVNAQLPALHLLIFISLAAFVLLVVNIRRQGWVLPVIAVGLWAFISVIVGAVYPAFIQRFRVEPSEVEREAKYIDRNIKATRHAMNMDNVEENDFQYAENLTSEGLASHAATIRNVRLWDPAYVRRTYQRQQEIRQYYEFNDVDVDRYTIDGQLTQTIVSARELNVGDLPRNSWVNRHLEYTHGYGAVVSPANAVTTDGTPQFLVKDVPPVGTPEITQPRIYYGDGLGGFAVVRTRQQEVDYQERKGNTKRTTYDGRGGVEVSSFLRRAAFALRFGDRNLLFSGLVNDQSRVIFQRDIRARAKHAAPFLRYDSDPYPVVHKGRIVWVQDAYTTTSRYPNAQQADNDQLPSESGLRTSFNYARNSVKVVTDAHDGTMTFYVVDDRDPIAAAYRKAFPKLFTPGTQMDPELRAHMRYPEDVFRVQTNMYGRYHITDPEEFYGGTDAWNVSQDPGSGKPDSPQQSVEVVDRQNRRVSIQAKRMDPTYLLLRLPGDEKESFLILRPFVAASEEDKQQNMTAFMIVKSDPGEYGKMQVFEMPRGEQIDGPSLIDARIKANDEISKEISLLNQQGSEVLQGNVLVLPIDTSVLYVRPLYVQSKSNPVPELRRVVVVYGRRAEMGTTLQEALTKVFGAAPPTLEQGAAPGGPPPAPGAPGTGVSPAVRGLLDQGQAAYDAAQAALTKGDLAEYQRQVNVMADLLRQARQASQSVATTTPTTAPAGSA